MGYELGFAPGVESEITDYALGFPEEWQDRVIDQIESQLYRLATNPRIAGPVRGAGPRFAFTIVADEIRHDLLVAWRYSQDEKFVVITGFRRLIL